MRAKDVMRRLRRYAPMMTAIGAALMLVQNLLLLTGVELLLTGSPAIGTKLISTSLIFDLAGILLIGLGIIFLTLPETLGQPKGAKPFWTPAKIGIVSGILCLTWFILTIGWRVIGLGAINQTLDAAIDMPSNSDEFTAIMTSLFFQVQVVMTVWIAASLSLAMSSVMFALYMKKREGWRTGVVAWPFFCILNMCATLFLAGIAIALTGGGVDFPLIVTAAALKLATVPFFGILAYISLTWKFFKFTKAERGESEEKVEPPVETSDAQRPENEESH